MPVQHVTAGKHPLRQTLADDRHRFFARFFVTAVGLGELTAGEHGNTEQGEEVWCGKSRLRVRLFTGRGRVALDGDWHCRPAAGIAPWREFSASDAFDTG